MLFASLGNPAVAGNLAGQLFAAQTWVALGCGLVLLVHFRAQGGDAASTGRARTAIFLVVAALLLALLQQYAVVAAHPGAREPQALACAGQRHVPRSMGLRRRRALAHAGAAHGPDH